MFVFNYSMHIDICIDMDTADFLNIITKHRIILQRHNVLDYIMV